MKLIYKLLLIGSMLFMSACSTNLSPRGWKKVEIKNKNKTYNLPKLHKQKISKSYKKFRKSTNLRKSLKYIKILLSYVNLQLIILRLL